MLALLAVAPIAAVLVLMVAARWSAMWAGTTAAILAVAIALIWFDFGGDDAPYSALEGLAGVAARAGWVALTVVLIIGPALAIHHLQVRSGATARLEAGLARLTPDPRVAAILIVWFFTLFIEGAAGFGTPVALAAPFLVAAGFKPVAAVTAALVGHTAGVTFGAVGTPVLAQTEITDYAGVELSWAAAPYQVVVGVVLAVVVARLIGSLIPQRGAPWGWMAAAFVLFFGPFVVLARWVGPELPSLGGALIGAVAFVALVVLWRRWRPAPGADAASDAASRHADRALEKAERHAERHVGSHMTMLQAATPYLVVVALVLVTRLVAPVRDGARSIAVEWQLFDVFTGQIEPLYHPSVVLILAWLIGGIAQRVPWGIVVSAGRTAVAQVVPVFAALVAMVTVAFTMATSGMTEEVALAAAATGAAWPLLAPTVGALGTFMTGSATASNILFTDFQVTTAAQAEVNELPMLGAQTSGAAIGGMIAPHNVVAAAATVGLAGKEGTVLRKTLPITGVCLVIAGVAAAAFAA